MKTIDTTLLIDPAVKAGDFYLAYFLQSGLRPKHIILLDRGQPSWKKRLKKSVKDKISGKRRREAAELAKVKQLLNMTFSVVVKERYAYEEHCENFLKVSVDASGVNGNSVISSIKTCGSSTVVFGGGGIVNKQTLATPNVKFIHTHPGIVPDIRGADCFFWSILERGKPGYSCFFMAPGIDEGPILHVKEYELPKLSFLSKFSSHIAFRGILETLDLHYRADCLSSFIRLQLGEDKDLAKARAIPQDKEEGRTYFFMHPEIKDLALRKLMR